MGKTVDADFRSIRVRGINEGYPATTTSAGTAGDIKIKHTQGDSKVAVCVEDNKWMSMALTDAV